MAKKTDTKTVPANELIARTYMGGSTEMSDEEHVVAINDWLNEWKRDAIICMRQMGEALREKTARMEAAEETVAAQQVQLQAADNLNTQRETELARLTARLEELPLGDENNGGL